ncbi:MAG: HIT family protein [Candidatus Micrarchaeota archaeon]|nr:HIT family protein [Candidatus Micrarchaeota archaeon]
MAGKGRKGTDPFCIKGKIEQQTIFESRHFYALYDIRPVVPGHCLLVPKRHVLDMMELTVAETKDFHRIAGKVIPVLLKEYSREERSYDLTAQIGPYSGRTVKHLHFHVLPRGKRDEYQKRNVHIYLDIESNRTNLLLNIKEEVRKLRKALGYRQAQRAGKRRAR